MKPSLGKAMLGGLTGTVLITMMMYIAAPMMLGQEMDTAAMLGTMLGGSWTLGMIMHLVNGIVVFPLIYVYAAGKLLPGAPWQKGAGWGAILWLISQAMVMPMMGAGFFSSHTGGMMAAVASLMGHLIYGAALGGIAGEAFEGLHRSAA